MLTYLEINDARKCSICNEAVAILACSSCNDGLHHKYFCEECSYTVHLNAVNHNIQEILVDTTMNGASTMFNSKLQLLSVICYNVETQHYVCFSRANEKWLFHDSMADKICEFIIWYN